jgi:hypothetical protein
MGNFGPDLISRAVCSEAAIRAITVSLKNPLKRDFLNQPQHNENEWRSNTTIHYRSTFLREASDPTSVFIRTRKSESPVVLPEITLPPKKRSGDRFFRAIFSAEFFNQFLKKILWKFFCHDQFLA